MNFLLLKEFFILSMVLMVKTILWDPDTISVSYRMPIPVQLIELYLNVFVSEPGLVVKS